MNVTLNIKLVNSEFNAAFANELYNGEESEDNIKYIWEDEFEVKGNVSSFKVKHNTSYILQGLRADDSQFSFEIPDMTVCECALSDGTTSRFAFSKKLIKSTEKIEDEKGNIQFFVFLKETIEHINPMDGVYILKDDFPLELQ
jgi:hypothetical protein